MSRNKTKLMTILAAALVVGLALAIPSIVSYGGTPAAQHIPATQPIVTNAAPSPSPAGDDLQWKDMNHKQRAAYMKSMVLPRMKQEFIAMDAKRFGRMNCMTCHGDGAKNDSFKMPNPKLPKLPTTQEGFQKLKEKFPDMMNFMSTKVKPDMALLLDMPVMSQQNPKGFSCMNCHTSE